MTSSARNVASEDGPIMEITFMKACGRMTSKMDTAALSTKMEATMRENTKMAIDTDLESTLTRMASGIFPVSHLETEYDGEMI